jgi:hypothetical protein
MIPRLHLDFGGTLKNMLEVVTMRRWIKRKLHSKAGESIGETLVAVLISALALVILAGAIGAATRIITRSNAAVKLHYDADADRAKVVTKNSELITKLEDSLR